MDNTAVIAALDQFDAHMNIIGTCGDGGCIIVKPKGMHTNGGCRCWRDHMKMQRYAYATIRLREAIRAAAAMAG
jgi:hypothetical protein